GRYRSRFHRCRIGFRGAGRASAGTDHCAAGTHGGFQPAWPPRRSTHHRSGRKRADRLPTSSTGQRGAYSRVLRRTLSRAIVTGQASAHIGQAQQQPGCQEDKCNARQFRLNGIFHGHTFYCSDCRPVADTSSHFGAGEHGSDYPLFTSFSRRPSVVSPAFHTIPEADDRLLDELATWPTALVAKRLILPRLLSPCPGPYNGRCLSSSNREIPMHVTS